MAEVLGPMTVIQRALPTGVDGTKMAQWRMRNGITFQEFVNRVGAAIGGLNEEMMSQWGFLFSLTEEDIMEYEDGGSVTELPDITDESDPDIIHGTTIGHMIDLRVYGRALGGTRRYFRDSREAQILSTLRTFIRTARWRFERRLLNRLFLSTETAIGSVGYNVPFVHGTGGNVDFAPPAYEGVIFTTSHDHFVFNNTGYAELLDDMVDTLHEHGHQPPYDAIVSDADVAAYQALAGFIKPVSADVIIIDRGGASSGNELFMRGQPQYGPGGVFGGYESKRGRINLRSNKRVATDYAALFKSYGQNDDRNPLKVRVHPEQGFGLWIEAVGSDRDDYPIRKLTIEMEFGVGVGADRTNGVVGRQNSSYTDTTIT